MTTRSRWHDATGNGSLKGPSGAQPKSRDSYVAFWHDGVGREIAAADYGTNDNVGLPTRTDSPPNSDDTLLVGQTSYNVRGEVEIETNPANQAVRTTYDDVGRVTSVVQNHGATPTEEVQTAYTPDGQVKMLTVINSDTGNQVTEYAYGVTLTKSGLASNNLLASVTYPDSGVVSYEYNRQSERTEMADQNGSVHDYAYDKHGRQFEDKVSTLGVGVDGSVRRIASSYDNRRRLEHVTSYDAVTGGNVTSDIQYAYDAFGQIITEHQQHGAAVNASNSPRVGYAYASGLDNTVRRERATYPDGTVLVYGYGVGAGDQLSRIEKLSWDSADVVEYEYLGLNQVVIQKDTEPATDIEYTLASGSGVNPYAGIDRFGRVVDLQWNQGSTELVRLKHGYDRAGNRLYRRDEVARDNSASFDELYQYDGLNRLVDFDRGELNPDNTGLTGSPALTQGWKLDATGNSKEFNQTVQDALAQTRSHNRINEITGIAETFGLSWADPAHDANGNMTTIPQPKSLDDSYTATWDPWNRLVKLVDDSTTVAEYALRRC